MSKCNQFHPGVVIVLCCQLVCLGSFACAADSIGHSKWLGGILGFSFLFGLILSVGFFGDWAKVKDEVDLLTFLGSNPLYLTVAIATIGEMMTILLVPPG
jgi:hypothetical protein